MNIFILFLLALSTLFNHELKAESQLPQSVEIISGNFYVVQSYATNGTKSNIYVIKGNTDLKGITSVFIFGGSFGDPTSGSDQSDFAYYRNNQLDAKNSAYFDMSRVDQVITSSFGLVRDKVVVVFVTAHGHLDHMNNEMVQEIYGTLGYSRTLISDAYNGIGSQPAIYVHSNDYFITTCNQPYCGGPTTGEKGTGFGAPFNSPWTKENLDLFVQVYSNTNCASTGVSFGSSSGTWTLYKDKSVARGGHTNGAMNLYNKTASNGKAYWIRGAAASQSCAAPTSTTLLNLH